MNVVHFPHVAIGGISCAVPCNVVKNIENKNWTKHDIERFIKGTGVKERRLAIGGQTASDLCFVATRQLLHEFSIDKNSIGAIIFITTTPDYIQPSTAYVLASRLGLSNNCMAFDVNLGCSAFVYGVHMVSSFLCAAGIEKALLLTGEVSHWGYENKKDELLSGNCGTATLLIKDKLSYGINSVVQQDGSRYGALIIKNGAARHYDNFDMNLYMQGLEILNFSVDTVVQTINDFLQSTSKKIGDFDYVLFHQANMLIDKSIARKIGAEIEQVPFSIEHFGNTGAASIPLTLVDLKMRQKEMLKDNLHLLSSGFGVGLSWGVNSFDIKKEAILPLIETNEIYEEAL